MFCLSLEYSSLLNLTPMSSRNYFLGEDVRWLHYLKILIESFDSRLDLEFPQSTSLPSIILLRPILLIKLHLPKTPIMLLHPLLINLLNLRRRQLKARSPQVIAQPLLLRARRDRHNVLINAPPQRDLILADPILLRQAAHIVVDRSGRCFGCRAQWAERRGRDAVLFVQSEELVALQVRVEFDLVACWDYFGGFEDGVEVRGEVVGHAD